LKFGYDSQDFISTTNELIGSPIQKEMKEEVEKGNTEILQETPRYNNTLFILMKLNMQEL